MIPFYLITALLGLVVGSFLNVCIWRIPREKSLLWPGSRCPGCDTPIKPWDNVPVLSYLMLGGKCRKCKTKISPRYPMVEALNAVLYLVVLHRWGVGWHLPLYMLFVSSLVVLTFIDLEFQIIPDRISITGMPIGLLASAFILPDPFSRPDIFPDMFTTGFFSAAAPYVDFHLLGWKSSLIGMALGFGAFFGIAVLSGGGMGGGDIKLMGTFGAFLGWKGVLLTTFVGSLTGSVVGGGLMLFKGKGRKTKVPFGPFLAFGALVSLLFGAEIMNWYTGIGR